MAWAFWLAPPVLVTSLVAIWTWLRGRPARTPRIAEAMRGHQAYLDTLVVPARGVRSPAMSPPAETPFFDDLA
jgi:hypothetical protein